MFLEHQSVGISATVVSWKKDSSPSKVCFFFPPPDWPFLLLSWKDSNIEVLDLVVQGVIHQI